MGPVDAARLARVRTAIKQAVSDILRSFKDPRLGFVSVTDVDVSKDARVAKIFISVLGGDEEKAKSLAALKSGSGYVRTELGQRLALRHAPEVLFRLDESIERGTRIQGLLGKLYPGGVPANPGRVPASPGGDPGGPGGVLANPGGDPANPGGPESRAEGCKLSKDPGEG